jgi:hypothetical protein
MMDPKSPTIYITAGPSVQDPFDQAPIGFIHGTMGQFIQMSARNWRVRLAIWALRRYVSRAIKGSR